MNPESNETLLARLAERAGASDLFVLRRITGDRFAHLGGAGGGERWAGVVEVGLDESTLVRDALVGNRIARVSTPGASNVFGPYFASAAVAVPVLPDTVVVLGQGAGDIPMLDGDELRTLAVEASAAIEHVSPAKRLADELEVLHAARAMSEGPSDTVVAAMQHVVECAAASLSCELGVLYLRDPERVAVANRGWPLDTDDARVLGAMRELWSREERCPLCVQVASEDRLPAPFARSAGIRSYYLLSLRSPELLLLVMHTDALPRGFTTLCQELGLKLVAAAHDVLTQAMTREHLRDEIKRLNAESRRDALTGLGNRLAWDEAIAGGLPAARSPISVIVLDVDDLKQANDSFGHPSGDEVLRAVADVLRGCVRDCDLVARFGGDEFGILLPGTDEVGCEHIASRIGRTIVDHPGVRSLPLSVSLGYATCDTGGSLEEAATVADLRLVEGKSVRRSRRLSA